MKVFKSIKWRLQLWYGLLLVLVLAGFGVTAYQMERGRQFQHTDNELQRRLDILAKTLHLPPRDLDFDRGNFNRPAPGRLPGDFLSEPPGREFHLPAQAENLFGTNTSNDFYFIIRGRDKTEIARSDNVPQDEMDFNRWFIDANHAFDLTANSPQPFASKNFHDNRALFRRLPSGETILIGCSVAPELRELRLTALRLTGVGALILFLGLAGGWWFVGRALRPVSEISRTAAKISAGDLSQRINVAEAESELGQLAAVLNSTFARLETAFTQQKQFASDAAHELRTPVSVILTQTQTALNRERSAAEYRETVEACQRSAQRMRKLIGALLELARFDAGQEALKRLKFDFSRTVADCAELVQPLADERQVKIIAELSPLEITGDPERLAQVATNLLTNAIQYNQPGGEVRVTLANESGLALLKIADTGHGIAAEDLPRVFERFYRADKSRTGAGNTGLGLSICKAIVEAHGGTIEVASESSNGSTFTVRLPA